MAQIKHALELLLNPFCLLLLVLMGCIVLTHQKQVRVGLLLVLCLFMVLSTGWLPRYFTQQLESYYPVIQKADPRVRYIVVLSGGKREGEGMPANDLLAATSIKRLLEGIRLFKMLPDATLILSGGGTNKEEPEAALLGQLAEWFALPRNKVRLETHSLNTADQARELKAFVGKQPFYLVTSAIHMPRSMYLCQQQGLQPIAAPTDFTLFWDKDNIARTIIPNAYNLFYFTVATHEALGLTFYKLFSSPPLRNLTFPRYKHFLND